MVRVATAVALLLTTASTSWSLKPWQPAGISSPQFESHPAFDPANGALYLVRSSPQFRGWKIFVSQCARGRWSDPRPVSFASKGGVEADPFLTNNGRTLYFISSRQDDGITGRGLDLWRVDRLGASKGWGRPARLPEPINSVGNEWFPRLSKDGWLYFGSDRAGGLGQTDIYRSRQTNGRWHVENLGPQVNSSGDEYEAEISRDGRRMILIADGDLFELTRSNGKWGHRTKLSPAFNGDTMEVGPLLSPSGRSLLFARDMGKAAGAGEFILATRGRAEAWLPTCK